MAIERSQKLTSENNLPKGNALALRALATVAFNGNAHPGVFIN